MSSRCVGCSSLHAKDAEPRAAPDAFMGVILSSCKALRCEKGFYECVCDWVNDTHYKVL